MRTRLQAKPLLWGQHGLTYKRTIVAFHHTCMVQQAESLLLKLGSGALLRLTYHAGSEVMSLAAASLGCSHAWDQTGLGPTLCYLIFE